MKTFEVFEYTVTINTKSLIDLGEVKEKLDVFLIALTKNFSGLYPYLKIETHTDNYLQADYEQRDRIEIKQND